MKRYILLVSLFALMVGCDTDGGSGFGRIKLEVFDNPPPTGVEHIYLTITEVNVSKSDEDWIMLAEPNVTYDFLELINGATAVLVDDVLETGDYAQLRLVVSESNKVVIDGETFALKVPSGEQTGVKLNLDFTVEEDELIQIYVDFDASKSITWTPGNYILHPTFKAFKKVISGTVAGTVKDRSGAGIQNALVEASGSNETIATVTDSTGAYKLILVESNYDVSASASGYSTPDTLYEGLSVQAEAKLTDYGFVLQ